MERRLAAIMVTDVVGYSRLIRADEEGTIAALKSLRADLIYPKIDEHHGREKHPKAKSIIRVFLHSLKRLLGGHYTNQDVRIKSKFSQALGERRICKRSLLREQPFVHFFPRHLTTHN